MNLNFETILNFYTIKRRNILCQIIVGPKSNRFQNSCRCLSEEQWLIFDKKLEKVLTVNNYLNDERCHKFHIKPYIEVKVQKSKLSFKHFYKILDLVGEINKADVAELAEQDLVLECLIDFQLEVPLDSCTERQVNESKDYMSPDGKLCNQLPYEPYTPSKKKLKGEHKIDLSKTNVNDYLESNIDTYSPKPLSDIGGAECYLTQEIPQYTPGPINTKLSAEEKKKINILVDKIDEKCTSVKHKSLKIKPNKKHKRVECEYIPKSQDVTTVNVPIYIPTPIEEITRQKLCSADNFKRKRSNTIDVFSDLQLENDKEEQMPKIEREVCNEKQIHRYNQSLKKRSMTIDEIPAELADMPAYIPTPLEEAAVEQVLKTYKLRKNKERSSSIEVVPKLYNENTKENHITDKWNTAIIDPCHIRQKIANSATNVLTKSFFSREELQKTAEHSEQQHLSAEKDQVDQGEILQYWENNNLKKYSLIFDGPTAELAESKILHKSKENGQLLTVIEENKSSKIKPEEMAAKSLLSDSGSFVKNSKKPSRPQRKEIDIKSKECYERIQDTKNQQLLDNSFINDMQKSLKRDIKSGDSKTETTKCFRRSERSPNKPKRLIEEHPVNKNTSKKYKPSPKNKELFGTDDDDDDDEHCYKNKTDNYLNNDNKVNLTLCKTRAFNKYFGHDCLTSSSPPKKKHKRDKNYKAAQDRNDKKSKHSPKITNEFSSYKSSLKTSWKHTIDDVNVPKSSASSFEMFSKEEKRKCPS